MSPVDTVSVPHLAEGFVLVHKLATYWGGSPRKRWLRCEVGHNAADRGTEDVDTDNGQVDTAGRGEFGPDRQSGSDMCTAPRVEQLAGTRCAAQGAQFAALWWPRGVGRGGEGREGGHTCIQALTFLELYLASLCEGVEYCLISSGSWGFCVSDNSLIMDIVYWSVLH